MSVRQRKASGENHFSFIIDDKKRTKTRFPVILKYYEDAARRLDKLRKKEEDFEENVVEHIKGVAMLTVKTIDNKTALILAWEDPGLFNFKALCNCNFGGDEEYIDGQWVIRAALYWRIVEVFAKDYGLDIELIDF